jgi:hypothetical protein
MKARHAVAEVLWSAVIMVQRRPPSISEFVYVSAREWLTLMSGILTVPFAILAFIFRNVRWIFVALAVCAFAFTVYRIWSYERRQLVDLDAHLAPRLRIEFDPLQLKFVSCTPVVGGLEMLYVRVLDARDFAGGKRLPCLSATNFTIGRRTVCSPV